MNEFTIIEHYFAKRSSKLSNVLVGIGDDAAMVNLPEQQQLVITTDTSIENVHFVKNTAAFDIGHKTLAVNLSDLAAMGATPTWATLALTLPHIDDVWLTQFADGFFSLANQYQVQLIGGDLTKGALSITITAFGTVPKPKKLLRSGAQVGDLIYVTGKLGAPMLALKTILNNQPLPDQNAQDAILLRLNRPKPRVMVGQQLLSLANACIDISDGLIQDLQHILVQSKVGARINIDAVPIDNMVREHVSKEAINLALTGGDEYELCFTLPPTAINELEQFIKQWPCACTHIGEITAANNVVLHDKNGNIYEARQFKGFTHF